MSRRNKIRLIGSINWIVVGVCLTLQSSATMANGVFGGKTPNCSPSESRDRKDYRRRDSTSRLRWQANDTYKSHIAPATRRMDKGDYSTAVVDDLNFTLARWPNHYPALQLLLRFAAAGGLADRHMPVSCYFQRANWLVPDDANIYLLYGVYRHKAGEYEAAENSWKIALSIDNDSAEAHYNLGLLNLKLKNYSSAVEHARVAYDLGYPLPGLKGKLIEQGHWEN